MSSSHNTVSSSPRQSFLLSAIFAAAPRTNNINHDVTLTMPMIQPPNSVAALPKKRRAGNPHQDAEVIALSPRTIMASNKFVCNACKREFPRVQNLQLHMRVHKPPRELKQKSNVEVRKKVYVCPHPTCLHHDPSRALGDITGMKKHFYRKHCEKSWQCEKCTKRYALQSDLKAHSKICGTKFYGCDCGTIFSRIDKYTTHKTFCDVLIQELASLKNPPGSSTTTVVPHGISSATTATAESGRMFTFSGDDDSNPSPNNFLMQEFVRNNPNLMNQHRGNFQGLMNAMTMTATIDNQGRPSSSIYDIHLGDNLSIGGSNRMTFDFFGDNGRGGHNRA